MTKERDEVVRRLVIEYGHWYAYVYLTDGNGKLLEEEAFRQPFRLTKPEVHEEIHELWQYVYQWLQDNVLWYTTARDDEKPPDSGEDDAPEE